MANGFARSGDLFAAFTAATPNGGTAFIPKVALTNDTGVAGGTVQGNSAAAATDSGDPVKVGGRYDTTFPTLTNGQRGNFQIDRRGAQYVQSLGSRTYTHGQVALTNASAVLVCPASAARTSVIITALTAVAFYLGGAGVTASTGHFVPAGGSITINTAEVIYAIGAANVTVSYLEMY